MKWFFGIALLVGIVVWVRYFEPERDLKKGVLLSQFHVDTKIHDDILTPKVDAFFQEKLLPSGFSGSVLVAHEGKVIYENSWGMANFVSKADMTQDAVFQLASVSKTFTSAAVLLLYQRGLIDLNAPVQEYIPEFPFGDITVHHLLTHRSGLQRYMYFVERYSKERQHLNNEDVLKILVENKDKLGPIFPPGTKYDYSNTGFVMLVLLVERVSGEEFADFMREEFFEPLGMKHTSIGRPQSKDFVLCAGHYHNTRQIAPFYQDEVLGDKSVYSSAEDMFRWDRSFSDEYILNNETLKLAFTDWEPDRNGLHNYGYGWRILHYPNGESFEYHTGWYRGYTSLFVRLRSTNSCIVILSNRVNKSFMVTYHDLVAILK